MTETSLEELVQERQFAGILQTHAEVFFRLSNTLLATTQCWNKKHFFQLINEADALESFLDDFGARYNRSYGFLTELVASLRGFAQAGYSLAHLAGRLESYGALLWMQPGDYDGAAAALQRAQAFVRAQAVKIMEAARREAAAKGVELTPEVFAESNFLPVAARRRLPRNCGQADLVDERQKIAEVAAKYLQACEMLLEIGVRPLSDQEERRRFFARMCTEEQARVYEATVHNLQSTYDTHIQNTLIEGGDDRLGQLRGHASAALHLLEAVTYLVHFIERHENEVRNEEAKRRVSELIDRSEVQAIVLNDLLHWADRFLQTGAPLAEALLPAYSNLQRLEVEIPDHVTLHARPAALIVGIVNRHGTPVEMELCGQRCNAGSILELLVAVGSSPGEKRFVFHGDERPLRDIRLLFEHRLGERGIASLPEALDYLRDA